MPKRSLMLFLLLFGRAATENVYWGERITQKLFNEAHNSEGDKDRLRD